MAQLRYIKQGFLQKVRDKNLKAPSYKHLSPVNCTEGVLSTYNCRVWQSRTRVLHLREGDKKRQNRTCFLEHLKKSFFEIFHDRKIYF